MSKELAMLDMSLPAHLQSLELDDTTKALMGSGGSGSKRISIEGGVWRLLVNGKEIAQKEERNLNVVIVAASSKVARTYYAGTYKKGVSAPPDCWSANGDYPDKSVEAPQATGCANCPQNIKGSGQGEGRACRFSQRIAVVLDNDVGGDVFQLVLPSTSIFGEGEAALVGVAIGMSLMGTKSFAEIMFGDFMTHTFDQLISNASKFHHMYAFQASVPLRIRTPMGGKRGYGPTHSQSLEKHFLGIDNVAVIAFSSLLDPEIIIDETNSMEFPLVLLENKVDYGKYLWSDTENYQLLREQKPFGALKLCPRTATPTITIVSYGETARHIADNLELFFIETDYIPELICVTQMHPLDINLIERCISKTKKLLSVEDGSIGFGFGAEVLSRLIENGCHLEFALRVGAEAVPVPSIVALELEILPTINRIIALIKSHKKGSVND